MVTGKPEVLEGSAVGPQLIRDHPFRREALLSHQLAHELDGSAPVSPALNQNVENSSLRDRRRAIDTSACPRSGRPSRRDAIDRSAEDEPAAAAVQSAVRISAPSCARSHRRCRAHARPSSGDAALFDRLAFKLEGKKDRANSKAGLSCPQRSRFDPTRQPHGSLLTRRCRRGTEGSNPLPPIS